MPVLARYILTVAVILVLPALAVAERITVFSDGVADKAELYELGTDEYMSVDALARVLKGDFEWDERLHAGRVTVRGHSVVLIPDNPFVSVDNSLISVPVTPQFHGGKLMVSVLTVPAIFSKASGKRVVWYPEVRMLSIGRGAANIKGIRFLSSPSETRVVLDLARPLKYRASSLSQDRYEIFLGGGVLNSRDISKTECPGLVRSVVADNTEDGARVVINLAKKNVKPKTVLLRDPDRLLLTFTPAKNRIVQDRRALKVVVIDPGHGGKDPGAVGQRGLEEKTVTLDIAKRVAELVEERLGIDAVLTRSTDEFVSLKERADIANKKKADLFVSIHCNSSEKQKSRGTETYFLSVAKTDWARAVEARENAVIKFELPEGARDVTSLEYILWDMAQNEFVNESSELAESVHEELTARFAIEDRGLKQAEFYVLKGCFMPAILVEVAFLSNRKEEKLLRKKSFRQKAAEAIYEGIKEFKRIYERKLNL
ncbi:MAG: N-acetylmuramoyl-L-alanine amidase [bacterium]